MGGLLTGRSFTPQQILEDPASVARVHDEPACTVLAEAARYITHVLTGSDPIVGRPGAICPFVASALRSDMITLSVLPLRTADMVGLREAALSIKAGFDAGAEAGVSRQESLRAAIILLPYLDTTEAGQLIETVQKMLKPEMVGSGLMVGEFYPGCAAPGLNNPAFRPADTSFACLAIRRMAAADLPFLADDAGFVESYLERFGEDGRRRLDAIRRSLRAVPDDVALDAGIAVHSAMTRAAGRCPVHAS